MRNSYNYNHCLSPDESEEYIAESRSNSNASLSNSNALVAIAEWRPFRWNADYTALSLLGLGLTYLVFREPLLVTVILSAGLFFYCLGKIISTVPILQRIVGVKIRFWHIAAVIVAIAATLSIFELPAQAVFLSGLEQFLTQIAQQSSTGGAGGGAVSPQAIKLVFNAIRAVFLLLVGVAALFAYNQAQQGNDWRPIATQAGLAIGIILTIDVITFLFVGNGTGGA
jgi:hypothetical protein